MQTLIAFLFALGLITAKEEPQLTNQDRQVVQSYANPYDWGDEN